MDEARARLAGYLNVATDEVHFGPSTSQNSYVLAQAFRQMLRPGDAIVVTNQDHEANSGAWRRLAESGISVHEWAIDPGDRKSDEEEKKRHRRVTIRGCGMRKIKTKKKTQ